MDCLARDTALMELHVRMLSLRLERIARLNAGPATHGADPVESFLIKSGADPFIAPEQPAPDTSRVDEIDAQAAKVNDAVAAAENEFVEAGELSRGETLRHLFGLDEVDWAILVSCFGFETDHRIRYMLAFALDNHELNYPCMEVLHRVFASDPGESAVLHGRCLGDAPLFRHRILHMDHESSGRTRAPIHMDPYIIHYLLGGDRADAARENLLLPPQEETIFRGDHDWTTLAQSVEPVFNARLPLILYFRGPENAEPSDVALDFARHCGIAFLELNGAVLTRMENDGDLLLHAVRESALGNKALLLRNANILKERKHLSNLLFELIESYGVTLMLAGSEHIPLGALTATCYEIPADFPGYETRARILREALASSSVGESLSIEAVASRFQLSARALREAANIARGHAARERGPGARLEQDDLLMGCKARSGRELAETAQLVPAKFGWDDLVVTSDTKELLREACVHLKFSERVYGEWGFDDVASAQRGLHLLFAGPPGTGKTMAAGVMASELGLEMYRVDLAMTVSKYIGETEKNLARIFAAAQSANAVLFFDEADALFGKRSEVSSSNDRYANIEVGYLLQQMESYRGITILATNLAENLDTAFLRRLHFTVEFTLPDREQRRRIWEIAFPHRAPLSTELDLDYLAEHLRISGGNIKNIARQAAFYAAEETPEAVISMSHIIQATRREYEKEGQSLTAADLGPYRDLLP